MSDEASRVRLTRATASHADYELALHHVAWEGVHLVRAHRALRGWVGSHVQPLVVSAAAIHTRSISHFLYATRDDETKKRLLAQGLRFKVHDSDILLEEFEVRPAHWIEGLADTLRACNKEVAHFTWDRVEARQEAVASLRKWAGSNEVRALVAQLATALSDVRFERGRPDRPVARDGQDYVEHLFELAEDMIRENDHMDGSASGMGTIRVDEVDVGWP